MNNISERDSDNNVLLCGDKSSDLWLTDTSNVWTLSQSGAAYRKVVFFPSTEYRLEEVIFLVMEPQCNSTFTVKSCRSNPAMGLIEPIGVCQLLSLTALLVAGF